MIGRLSLDVELTLTVAGRKLADIQAGSVSIECEMESKPGGIIVKTVADIDAREAMRAALKNALADLDASEPPKCDPREHEQLRELFERRSIIDSLRHCTACGEWLPPLDHLASTDTEPEPPCTHGSTTYTHGEHPRCTDCGLHFRGERNAAPEPPCEHESVSYTPGIDLPKCVACGERFQITKAVIPRDICDHGLVEFDSINKIVTCSFCGATRPTNAEWPAY